MIFYNEMKTKISTLVLTLHSTIEAYMQLYTIHFRNTIFGTWGVIHSTRSIPVRSHMNHWHFSSGKSWHPVHLDRDRSTLPRECPQMLRTLSRKTQMFLGHRDISLLASPSDKSDVHSISRTSQCRSIVVIHGSSWPRPVFYLHSSLLKLSKLWDPNFSFNYLKGKGNPAFICRTIEYIHQWYMVAIHARLIHQ